MQFDYRRLPNLTEQEEQLVGTLRRARAVVAVVVVGGIVLVAAMAGSSATDSDATGAPNAAAQDAVPPDAGAVALERGPIG